MKQNPFRYDSSDTEDDEQEGLKRAKTMKMETKKKPVDISKILWGESFFFKEGDERLKG